MSSADVMTGANENTTPSELIYLFVDGEASDLERTILFNALVGDAELQSELADAIRINSAAQQEMFETLPPASVTHALFRRIGDLKDQSRVGAAAVPATGVAPDRSPVNGAGDRERRRNLLWVPILTGMLGIGIGLLLSDNNGILPSEFVAEVRNGPMEMDGGARATTTSQDLQNDILDSSQPLVTRNQTGQTARVAAAGGGEASGSGSSNPTPATALTVDQTSPISVREGGITPDATLASENSPEAPFLKEDIDGDGTSSSRVSLLAELAVGNAYLDGEYRHPMIQFETSILDGYDLLAVASSSRLEDERPMEGEPAQQLSFFLRGGNQVTFSPDRAAVQAAAAENLQNLAIGGYYQVDDVHGVGIQGGRDFHPFYHDQRRGVSTMLDVGSGNQATNDPVILSHVGGGGIGGNPVIGFGGEGDNTEAENVLDLRNGSGETPTQLPEGVPGGELQGEPVSSLDPTIEWIGLGYRFRAPGIDRGGLFRPELQAAFGISTVGPVARTTLGLAWKPGTHVTLVAGVEGTGVFYRLDGEGYWSRRVGVVYGVEVGF